MKKLAILLLSIVLVVSCTTTTNSINRTITTSGFSEVTLAPDIATFSISISETKDSTQEAQKVVNERMAIVYQILSSYEVEDKDIRTTSMLLNPEYQWKDGEEILIGQSAKQSISVKFYDLDKLASIIDSLSAVSGISLSNVTLDREDKSEILKEARSKAILDAKAKAEVYAKAASLSVVSAITISEAGVNSSSPIYQPMAFKAAYSDEQASSAEFFSGDLTVSANVNVTFSMN